MSVHSMTSIQDELQAANVAPEEPEAAAAPTPEAPTEVSAMAASVPELETPVAIEEPAPMEAVSVVDEPSAPVEAEPVAAQAPVPEPEPELPAPAVADAPAAEPVSAVQRDETEDAALFEAALAEWESEESQGDTNYRRLSKGDRIEATVVQVEKDRVFVDLGTKSEGVVPLGELSDANHDSAHDVVRVGDKIQVVVLRPEGAEGNALVSKKRADFDKKWEEIERKFESQETFTATVVDRVKGGLVVDIGVRGFVPATHVGSGKLRNIEKYVGQPIQLKILEIDRDRKKVVLSNRQAEEERREAVKEEIFTKVAPGDVLEGTVRRLTDYGAFVDLGGIDGLLHISEMSWMRINHPKEVLKEGQKIKVMVLRLDQNLGKISLGLRQVLPDPWNLIAENYKIGQKIQCTINRIVQSGAFVKLPEGAEAFLPASEVSNRRVGRITDVLAEGQEVELTIIDLRKEERRMVLSLRGGSLPERPAGAGGGGGYSDEEDRMRGRPGPGGKKKRGRGRRDDEDDMDAGFVGRVPTGGATIGERLGMLKGFLSRPEEEEETEGGTTEEPEAAPAEEPTAE